MKRVSPGWSREPKRPRRSKRPSVRLGRGEYQPHDYSTARRDAQNEFLAAVHRVAPEVLRDLATEPLRLYQRLFAPPPEDDTNREGVGEGSRPESHLQIYDRPLPDARPIASWAELNWAITGGRVELTPLRDELSCWAGRWGLQEEWCLERAVYMLWVLSTAPPDDKVRATPDFSWVFPIPFLPHYISPSELEFTFTHPGWLPWYTPWDDYRQQVVDAVGKQLTGPYRDRIARLIDDPERQLVRTPEKRRMEHFEWLALFQVKRWTHRAIAETLGPDPDKRQRGVAIAVRETAKLVGLRLRTGGRPGRPPKMGT